MKNIITLVVLSMLSGCATLNYQESDLALTKNQVVVGALMGGGSETIYAGDSAQTILSQTGSSNVELALVEFKKSCEIPTKALVSPALIPILSAVPKILYDIAADKTNKKLEALKKSSSLSYSVDFVLPKDSINNYQCLTIIRHDKERDEKEKEKENKEKYISAAIAYKININGQLLSLKPVFIWARNTVANTREVKKGEKEEITFMSGLSLQGIGEQKNGISILASSGQDVKKIGTFELGEDNVLKITNSLSIGPVPMIPNSSVSILRVSLTEIGDLGFDVDDRIAANKTIKEAIGPALAEGITTYLKDE